MKEGGGGGGGGGRRESKIHMHIYVESSCKVPTVVLILAIPNTFAG